MPNYIDDLKNNLKFALANVALRREILADVGKYAPDGISDVEVVQIYTFVAYICSKPHVRSLLERMTQEAGKIIARSTKDTDYPNSPPLPRSLVLRKLGDEIRVGFVENSKTATGKNPKLKLKRSVTTVSRILDITPGMVARVVPLTTKSYVLGQAVPAVTTPRTRLLTAQEAQAIQLRKQQIIAIANATKSEKAYAWQKALQTVRASQQTGLNTLVCDTYIKKNGIQAVRTIEPWCSANLFTIRPLMATWSPEFIEGFVYDTVIKLLTQIDKMHNELQIVHGDINPETIGFMLTGHNKPKIKFKDFENSFAFADLESKLPVSKSAFCSPKVVKFSLYADEGIRNETLHAQFSAPNHGGGFAVFAQDAFDTLMMLLGIDDPASQYRPEYVNTLRYGPDDDMFSLGITLFVLITGHYPTVSGLQGQAYDQLHYLRVQDAYRMYPQYAPLLKGLLFVDHNRRLNAKQALAVFDKIPDPHVRAEAAESADESVSKYADDRETGSTFISTSTSDTVSPPTTGFTAIEPAVSSSTTLSDVPRPFQTSSKSAFSKPSART